MTSSRRPARLLAAISISPFLWGLVSTVAFYRVIPHLPVYRELAVQYFCSHPLETATATLFFIGMATLAIKALTMFGENTALAHLRQFDATVKDASTSVEKAERLQKYLQSFSSRMRGSHAGRRIEDVCEFVRGRCSVDGLEEHMKYLAELAMEQLHRSYGLVRTVTWAVPILGFLGTVIGITIAIARVTPQQLDTSLNEVTGGLAVAFDTTALALALSLILVFATYLIERAEQNALGRVEEFGTKQLLLLFPPEPAGNGEWLRAEKQAADLLLQQTDSLVQQQVALWQDSLATMRERWTKVVESQQQAFEESLQQGLSVTLDNHSTALGQARNELLQGFRKVSTDLTDSLASWQTGLNENGELLHSLQADLRTQTETLLKLADQENSLNRLEERLADNLEALRAAESLEATLHSLNAAVHLLTARAKPKAA